MAAGPASGPASRRLLSIRRRDTLVYCCGPEGLLERGRGRVQSWPEGSLHIERFSAKALAEPSPDALASFEVECQRSGLTLTVPRTSRSTTLARRRASTCSAPAWRASAGHASARCSKARSITVTPCSTTPRRQRRHHHDLRFALPLGKAGAGPMRPNYPFNCWYVAATSDEVGQNPFCAPTARHARRAVPPRLG